MFKSLEQTAYLIFSFLKTHLQKIAFVPCFIPPRNIIRSLIRDEKPGAIIPHIALHHIQFPSGRASFSLEE